MPSAFPLSHMTDAELVQHANAVRSDLTSTELEIELTDRLEATLELASFQALFEEHGENADEINDLLQSHPESIAGMAALLKKLNDEDIHVVAQLTKRLDLADQFEAIANDAGDLFARLQQLANTTQE